MVQRMVPSKLCIQNTDNLRSENQTGKLRSPSPRFQDVKNKGTEVDKKMKRSKSMKRSTIESGLRVPKFIKEVPQPGKTPTNEKQKQSPNYMKSTSSFEARKEESQVNSKASVKSTKKSLKNLKPSSNSADMPAKELTRASSLKKVRTSKKTPSCSPTKAANKNCSQVVLFEDSNSQRATCSSTLKDSKFSNYLKLSHGATESVGTSLTKVCPYTYCSLNGHTRTLLLPLNCFISEKRRMVKTQKNIKLGCLLPRKTKPSHDLEKEIFGEMVVDEKAATQEPMVQEDHVDFYIGIYDAPSSGNGRNEDVDVDGLSNDAPSSGNDFENNVGDCCEVMKAYSEFLPQEEQMEEQTEEVNSVKSNQEEEIPDIVSNQSEMELNETNSETCEIECEEGQHPFEKKDGYDSEKGSSGKEPKIFGINFFEEILVDKSEEVFGQFGDEEPEFIHNKEDDVFDESAEDKEPSTLLAKRSRFSGETQQEEIHEDYKSIGNNTQVFELEVSHVEVLVEDSTGSEDQTHSGLNKVVIADELIPVKDPMEIGSSDNSDQKESSSVNKDKTQKRAKPAYTRGRGCSSEDLQSKSINFQIAKRNKSEENLDKERDFTPREPNYLPLTPDLEAERVDLKHQDLDDRKNAEEWMIDYALQQTVSKLGPACKKKVALLVEAFEKVAPPHYEFAPIRPIQACS